MKRLLIMFSCFVYIGLASAASFDCGKASTNVEKLICNDEKLSKLDDELFSAYRAERQVDKKGNALKNSQIIWLKDRNKCIDSACINKSYSTRIEQLSTAVKSGTSQLPISLKIVADDCKVVANHINRGTLNLLKMSRTAHYPDKEDLKPILGKNTFSSTVYYWSVDLNNDGILDHVAMNFEGLMSSPQTYVISGKKDADNLELDDPSEVGSDVVNVGGRFYISDGYKLYNLSKSGELQSTCSFKQVGKPVLELVSDKINPLCLQINPEKLRYVDYKEKHNLGALPDDRETPHESIARVDLDNDGKKENVIRIDYMFLGRMTCSQTYIAVTNDDRSKILDSNLNQLLRELSSTPYCSNLDVFVQSNTTYIDSISSKSDHVIYSIKDNKADKVCEYKIRTIVEAVDINEEVMK